MKQSRLLPIVIPGLLFVLLLLGACAGTSSTAPDETPEEIPELPAGVDVVITLNSIGSSAWYVEKVEGSETVSATGMENPNAPWTLQVGSRYRIENAAGSSAHPFELLGEIRFVLLSQLQEGALEASEGIDYLEDDGVTFTMTQELADAVRVYYCNFHEQMEGSITAE